MVITPWDASLGGWFGVVTTNLRGGRPALCAQGFNFRAPPGVQNSAAVSTAVVRSRARPDPAPNESPTVYKDKIGPSSDPPICNHNRTRVRARPAAIKKDLQLLQVLWRRRAEPKRLRLFRRLPSSVADGAKSLRRCRCRIGAAPQGASIASVLEVVFFGGHIFLTQSIPRFRKYALWNSLRRWLVHRSIVALRCERNELNNFSQ